MTRSPARRYDAVIVGARCAGAATAMLLARSGLSVLLVDRAAPGTDTLSTHALMRAGVLQLSRWGLLDAVIAAGTPAITRTTFDYGSYASTVTIKPAAGVWSLYAPRRTVLDRLLVEAALAAGAEAAFGVSITGVQRDRHGRVCRVTGQDRHRRAFAANGRIVIGADGLGSTIADAVAAPVTGHGNHASGLWCTYVTGLPNDGYRWFYRPGAAAGLIPTNDGATCVFASTGAAGFRRLDRHERWQGLLDLFSRAAPNAAEELPAARRVEPVRGWPGVPGQRRQGYGPGWALVGDAGYFKDPIGTHGMTQALRDAELLADAVIAGHTGSKPLDTALADYARVRDDLSAGLFAATDAISGYDWDLDTIQQLLRQLASAMSREVDLLAGKATLPAGPRAAMSGLGER